MATSLLLLLCICIFSAAQAATIVVQVGAGGNKFVPNSVTAVVGDIVSFQFAAGTHTVSSGACPTKGASQGRTFDANVDSGNTKFDLGPLTTNDIGTIQYFCAIHCFAPGDMDGTITVNPAPVTTPGATTTAPATTAGPTTQPPTITSAPGTGTPFPYSACPATRPGSQKKWSEAGLGTGAVNIAEPIWLDINATVGALTIASGGALYFDPSVPYLILTASEIYVSTGGKFYIGCEANPYTKQADVVLTGAPAYGDRGPNGVGRKVIAVAPGAELGFFGQPRKAWTRLANNAAWSYIDKLGVAQLSLLDDMGWSAGDQIAIASTDYDLRQSEEATILSVAGKQLALTNRLKYLHFGQPWKSGADDIVDERAEVGLLTRNVRVYGQLSDPASNWGARLHVHNVSSGAAGPAGVRITGVEFFNVGQGANPTVTNAAPDPEAYAVHWNFAGSQQGSYFKLNSIHDVFNGGFAITGTSFLSVSQNVVFNTTGNGYAIRQSISTNNTFDSNCAIRINQPNSDAVGFYIGHPTNFITNNAIGGSEQGFLFDTPGDRNAAAGVFGRLYYPTWLPLGAFSNNVAHSCYVGLNIDSYDPRQIVFDDATVATINAFTKLSDVDAYLQSRPRLAAQFTDMIIYRASEVAISSGSSRANFARFALGDFQVGMIIYGDRNVFENFVIVGETDNLGVPQNPNYEQGRSRPRAYDWARPIMGIQLPACCAPNIFVNVRFHQFTDFQFQYISDVRYSAAISVGTGSDIPAPDYQFYNLKFASTVVRRVSFLYNAATPPDSYQNFVLHDTDGSLTGGLTGGGCGASIVGTGAHLRTPDCTAMDSLILPLYLCPANKQGWVRAMRVEEQAPSGGSVTKFDDKATAVGHVVRLSQKAAGADTMSPSGSGPYTRQYDTNVASNDHYLVHFGSTDTPAKVQVTVYSLRGPTTYLRNADEYVRVTLAYPSGSNFTVQNSGTLTLGSAAVARRSYTFDDATGLLTIEVRSQNSFSILRGVVSSDPGERVQITATCPGGVCTAPALDALTSTAPTASFGGATIAVCDPKGNGNADGKLSFTPPASPFYLIQGGQWVNGWYGDNKTFTQGNGAIAFTWNNYGGTYCFNNDDALPINSAFSLYIRMKGDDTTMPNPSGQYYTRIQFYDKAKTGDMSSVNLVSPFYTSSLPPDHTAFADFVVPFPDLGFVDGKIPNAFGLAINEPRKITVYVSDMAYGQYNPSFGALAATPTTTGNAGALPASNGPITPTRPPGAPPGPGPAPGTSSKKKSNTPLIIGVVVGAIVLLLIIVAVVLFIMMKKKKFLFSGSRRSWSGDDAARL